MNDLILVSVIPPSVNHYLVHYVEKRGAKDIVKSYLAPAVALYKNNFTQYVQKEIEKQGWVQPLKEQIVSVEMTFYVHKKKIDPNNLLKIPIDVLKEAGVYFDDDLVLPIVKRVYIDSNNPRVEIKVIPWQNVGIFDNFEDHDKFVEMNCNSCMKKGRCPSYRALLDNRIVKDIDEKNMICYIKKEKKK